MTKVQPPTETRGWVYCPICTHTVESVVVHQGRIAKVKTGEKCPRCRSALEAGFVLRPALAA